MPMIHAISTVAKDQSEISSKTSDLVRGFGLDTSDFLSSEVTHFGASRFLITLFYKGGWDFWETSFLGIKLAVKRNLIIARKCSSKLGLKTTCVARAAYKQIYKIKIGEKAVLAKRLVLKRLIKVKLGVKPTILFNAYLLRSAKAKIGFSLGVHYHHEVSP